MISASCNGFTNNLATLTVHELRKPELAYNLRDTNHFLQKVENINNSGILQKYDKIFMVSFDITFMFPSITKSHGLSVCREHLDKRINPLFSTQCIIEAINITLEHNISSFNGEFFRQIKGTAMGAKNVCDYADISMSKLNQYIHEEDLLSKHSIKPPVMFESFRDDIFAIFTDKDSINRCFNLINSFYDNIKFTMSQPSNIGIEFLDTFVSFQDYKLPTRPFSKSCDSHCYLTPKSCHPTHILENVPYSIAHRVFKISSDDKIYNASKSEYSDYLKARGYSAEIIDTSFKKVETLSCVEMIFKENKNTTNHSSGSIPLVYDYNPALPPMSRYINKHKHILNMDASLVKIINPNEIFTTYRANPTIRDLLVNSKLTTTTTAKRKDQYLKDGKSGSVPCKKGCKVCKDFLESPSIISSYHTDQQFKFKHTLDCCSKFVIYKIDDVICKKCYVGSTTIGISERWRNHKSHIRNNI